MSKLLSKSENFNDSYLIKIVKIKNILDHPNADRLKLVVFDGRTIITNLDAKEGDIRLLFPLECEISHEYLSANNEYSNKELNNNPEAKVGYFGDKKRLKAQKFRQVLSEGYLVPVDTLSFMLNSKELEEIKNSVGTEFDTINNIQIIKKYIIQGTKQQGLGNKDKQGKKARESKIIPDQFRFHTDTAQLGKNMFKIEPDTYIVISSKFHGTSSVSGRLLCKRPLKWHEKVLKKIGVKLEDKHYDLIYSSRKVIKNPDLNPNAQHFYKSDLWGEVAKKIEPFLHKGETLYGEIVGYTPEGSPIQSMGGKPYDYGCVFGTNKFYVYRITKTNVDGKVMDLSTLQMQHRCAEIGLETVPILYSGYAKDKYPNLNISEHWNEQFLECLKKEYLDKKCKICTSGVWDEGIVLRIEGLIIENLKLKSPNFICAESLELDSEIMDIETAESIDDEALFEN